MEVDELMHQDMLREAFLDLENGHLMPWDKDLLSCSPLPESITEPYTAREVPDVRESMRLTYETMVVWIDESKRESYFSKRFVQLSRMIMNGVTTMGRGLITLHARGEELDGVPMSIRDLIGVASYQFRKSHLGVFQTMRSQPEISEKLMVNQIGWNNMLMRLFKTKEKLAEPINSECRIRNAELTSDTECKREIRKLSDGNIDNSELISDTEFCIPNSALSAASAMSEPGAFTAPRAFSSYDPQSSYTSSSPKLSGSSKKHDSQALLAGRDEMDPDNSVPETMISKTEQEKYSEQNEAHEMEQKGKIPVNENPQAERKESFRMNETTESKPTDESRKLNQEKRDPEKEISELKQKEITSVNESSETDIPHENKIDTINSEAPNQNNDVQNKGSRCDHESTITSDFSPHTDETPGYLKILQDVYSRSGPSADDQFLFTYDEMVYLASDPEFCRIYPKAAAGIRIALQQIDSS